MTKMNVTIFENQVTESVRNLLCKAQGKQPLNSLLKHSHTLLR